MPEKTQDIAAIDKSLSDTQSISGSDLDPTVEAERLKNPPTSNEKEGKTNSINKEPATESSWPKTRLNARAQQQSTSFKSNNESASLPVISNDTESGNLVPTETSINTDGFGGTLPTGSSTTDVPEASSSVPITENSPTEKKPDSTSHDITTPIAIDEEAEDGKESEKKESTPTRWSVALLIAPDFSTTRSGNLMAPGEAYGLTGSYRFAKRFTITTGILNTAKKYSAPGEDYHPPKGYWGNKTNGVIPNEIYGECSVLEVPLTIQFDILQKSRSRFYVSSGLSSYRMMNERYEYSFNQANEGADLDWSSSRPSNYYFGVAHVSAGYERIISKHFSLGIEPYIKKPFRGIGWAAVELNTIGAYVNLRYRFNKKRVE